MKNQTIIYAMLGVCVFFSMIGSCTSCSNSKKIDELSVSTRLFMYDNYATRDEVQLMLEMRGLSDERRYVLNINQIFLTRKRPDERVIEIDEEFGKRAILLDNVRKQIASDVERTKSEIRR